MRSSSRTRPRWASSKSPGALGADVVVGEGHALGNPLSYGGPYVGLFATKLELVRQVPGRIAGETLDADGRRAFVLTLQAREQHIRRAKATSNVCTNQTLMAIAAAIHLSWLGPEGLSSSARSASATPPSRPSVLAAIPGCESTFEGRTSRRSCSRRRWTGRRWPAARRTRLPRRSVARTLVPRTRRLLA